jgi:nitrite reductase (NO-forming)
MNKNVFAGIFACVLAVGLLLGPSLSGITPTANAQAPQGTVKPVLLVAQEVVVDVAPANQLHPGGVKYNAMTFNGTIPAPVIAVDQGDTLRVTLRNDGQAFHSLDFHAGLGPSEAVGSGTLAPGESKTWDIKADEAGAFMYHCGADGLNGVWEHIANGMYGLIVVHPQNEPPAKEFYMTFSELYNTVGGGPFNDTRGAVGSFDLVKFMEGRPDLVLTNGMAHKYVPAVGEKVKLELNPNGTVFKVKPGELTRWYILNPGPNDGVSFHFISGQIDVHDGFIKNRYGTQLLNDETWWIPPGSASVIESIFPEEGLYVGVDHAMNDVVRGGAFAVLGANNSTATDHPEGTWVPPKGSSVVAGNATNVGNQTTTGTPEQAKLPGENVTGGETQTITEGTLPQENATAG